MLPRTTHRNGSASPRPPRTAAARVLTSHEAHRRAVALVGGLAVLLSCAASAAAAPAFTDVGPFAPAPFPESFLFDLSGDGSYLVGNTSTLSRAPFRWSEGTGLVDLGDLAGGSSVGRAMAISLDGSVVTGLSSSSVSSSGEAFRWTQAGGIVGLGGGNGRGLDVSDDGAVIVGTLSPATVGFYWTQSEGRVTLPTVGFTVAALSGNATAPPPPPRMPTDFGTLVGHIAVAGPDAGKLATWTETDGLEVQDFIGTPTRASTDASVIVGAIGGSGHAFRWTRSGGGQDLGSLAGSSGATGVSADGSLVVGWTGSPLGGRTPFLWDASHGMRDLEAVLTGELGLDLTGWDLDQALAISADGTVVAGIGEKDGADRIWVARIADAVPAPVPVLRPAALVGLAFALGAAGGLELRRRSRG